MTPEFLILRAIHIYGGILWTGTNLFTAFFLLPAMGMAGPAGAPVMGGLVKTRLFTIIPIVAVATMAAGLRMLWIVSTGFSATYMASRSGITYSIGASGAILAFLIFMSVNHPAIGQMTKLGQQMAQAPEAERAAIGAKMGVIRARAGKAGLVTAGLMSITALAMAVARYV
jgi:uncharacterized membrane protein